MTRPLGLWASRANSAGRKQRAFMKPGRFILFQLLPSAAWHILAPRNQPTSSELNDGF